MSKRFVTYRTEDAKAGLVNVDENGVMKHGGGSGLPEGGEHNTYLVTNNDGNVVWEKNLVKETKKLITVNYDPDITYEKIVVNEHLNYLLIYEGVLTDDEIRELIINDPYNNSLRMKDTWSVFETAGFVTPDFVALGESPVEMAGIVVKNVDGATMPDGTVFSKAGIYAAELSSGIVTIASIHNVPTTTMVKTIYEELLPDCLKPMIVDVYMVDDDGCMASATYDEIEKEILSGRTVVCKYGNHLFHLMCSPAIGDISTMIALPKHIFVNVSTDTACSVNFIEISSNNEVSMNTVQLTVAT